MEPKQISKIISNIYPDNFRGIERISYFPYDETMAKNAFYYILGCMVKEPVITDENRVLYSELIKYLHADTSYSKDLNKSIGILGPTGTGKTICMQIMSKYSEIDAVRYYLNGKSKPFKFHIFNSRAIVEDFALNGFDGIAKYCNYSTICIDDIGTENQSVQYYGTKINVIEELIEDRYLKGFWTHFTSNLTMEMIQNIYGSRVYSRLAGISNIHILNGKDLRLKL
jgi:DNA replication protein DnaC